MGQVTLITVIWNCLVYMYIKKCDSIQQNLLVSHVGVRQELLGYGKY